MSNPQIQWLMRVLQPEKTLGSLPGIATLTESSLAALLGIPLELYNSEIKTIHQNVKDAATELLGNPEVIKMVDRLPLEKSSKIVIFGDSLTADPQSWAMILKEILSIRRPDDGVSVSISAVPGETTTHGLVRIGEVLSQQPDWLIFFVGINDARTQGPSPTKTIVGLKENVANLNEMRSRADRESKARRLWITPPAINEEKVASHWGLGRFGVRFRNSDVGIVAENIRNLGDSFIDLFSTLGKPPAEELLMDDGLHLSLEGQKRIVLEVIRGWTIL